MADQHTSQAACFLGIPPELRLNIYTHYFATFILDTSSTGLEQYDLQASLLNTCQRIRDEGLQLYKARIEDAREEARRSSEECMTELRKGTVVTDMSFEAALRRNTCMNMMEEEQQAWARVSQVYASELSKIEEILRVRGS